VVQTIWEWLVSYCLTHIIGYSTYEAVYTWRGPSGFWGWQGASEPSHFVSGDGEVEIPQNGVLTVKHWDLIIKHIGI
jgi:hypothetical protein